MTKAWDLLRRKDLLEKSIQFLSQNQEQLTANPLLKSLTAPLKLGMRENQKSSCPLKNLFSRNGVVRAIYRISRSFAKSIDLLLNKINKRNEEILSKK